jgi:hypothetical protein
MDKYAIKGLKKLFSLTKTKLRLASESQTAETQPHPLPIVKLFSCLEANTVADCAEHWQRLKDNVDYCDDTVMAYATVQLCDIIEAVKYRFEPVKYMPLMREDEMDKFMADCENRNEPLRILLMTSEGAPSSIYFGEDAPAGSRHYSRVVSAIAPFLRCAYKSPHLSDGLKLKNIEVRYGRRTLLADAAGHAMETLIA